MAMEYQMRPMQPGETQLAMVRDCDGELTLHMRAAVSRYNIHGVECLGWGPWVPVGEISLAEMREHNEAALK